MENVEKYFNLIRRVLILSIFFFLRVRIDEFLKNKDFIFMEIIF